MTTDNKMAEALNLYPQYKSDSASSLTSYHALRQFRRANIR